MMSEEKISIKPIIKDRATPQFVRMASALEDLNLYVWRWESRMICNGATAEYVKVAEERAIYRAQHSTYSIVDWLEHEYRLLKAQMSFSDALMQIEGTMIDFDREQNGKV